MKREQLLARIRRTSLRDMTAVGAAAFLIIIIGFWAAAQFIRPAPPKQLHFATGPAGGAYQRYAAEYKAILDRYGI
jgi:hypothetical protein